MKQNNEYYLKPLHDSRNSFYNKATVSLDSDSVKLYSYKTLVAELTNKCRVAKVYNVQSQTTLRHVKEFLKQHGFKADSKQQIVNNYMEV